MAETSEEYSNKKKIPANIAQFQWNCSFNNLENREVLEKELPDIARLTPHVLGRIISIFGEKNEIYLNRPLLLKG